MHSKPIEKVIRFPKIHQRFVGFRVYSKVIQRMKEDGVWSRLNSDFLQTCII